MRARCFPPVAGKNPKVLILGSLPGAASLRLDQYYGHPRNRFWELLGLALGEDLRSLPYDKRLRRLKARGIALWDVVSSAHRSGSLDAAIRDEDHNAVAALVAKIKPRAIFLNGLKAAASFRRCAPGIPAFVLPSSSPANASVAWARKARAWRRVRAYL